MRKEGEGLRLAGKIDGTFALVKGCGFHNCFVTKGIDGLWVLKGQSRFATKLTWRTLAKAKTALRALRYLRYVQS